jgi:LmbE family N-acetylglucosaminyl deacetylase
VGTDSESRSATRARQEGDPQLNATSVLAVCAHPDDESFALGAILDRLAATGIVTSVLCFTRGEASTLGASAEDLSATRRGELAEAAKVLRAARVQLLEHPDGALFAVPLRELVREVDEAIDAVDADLLLVFDEGGVTGHPDHCRATEAALAASSRPPVLAWAMPEKIASALNAELATEFVGRNEDEIDLVLTVDRDVQRRAIACHRSQSTDNRVLWRRLALLSDHEHLRWLRPPSDIGVDAPSGGPTSERPREARHEERG